MEKSQINLNHFEFKVTKCKYSSFTKTIYVKSKPEYTSLYNDITLDYSFLSESGISQLDTNQNVIIAKLTVVQKRSLTTSIFKRLTRAIRHSLDVSKEFDFSEFDENTSISNDDFDFDDDVLSKDFNSEETLVDPKHLNDDFDFDEFNDEPESKPHIVGNESPAEKVFPKGFDFDNHTDSLISEMLQCDKEIFEVFKESQRVLEQKNKFQLQYDNLVKKGDWLYDKINKLQDDYEHAIKSQFNTK